MRERRGDQERAPSSRESVAAVPIDASTKPARSIKPEHNDPRYRSRG